MSDIDWLAVEMVVNGSRLQLNAAEKRMAIRRLDHLMVDQLETRYGNEKLTASDLAYRLRTTDRSVVRTRTSLPKADTGKCPICKDRIWIVAGTVEAHGDALYQDCPMSGRELPGPVRGLAAIRPDLYQWLETA